MNANLFSRKIEMTKTEAKAAGKVGSPAFNELGLLKAAYPTFGIEIKVPKSKDNMKGLTTDFMVKYIQKHDDEEKSIMKEYNSLRGLDEVGRKQEFTTAVSYGDLKMWFLAKFPEVEEPQRKIEEILKKASEKRAADKQKREEAQKNANNQTEE